MQKLMFVIACAYLTACESPLPNRGDLAKLSATECFWPPDMVPHPNPPWDQPSKDEPEMA
jgi:hypothetical protein